MPPLDSLTLPATHRTGVRRKCRPDILREGKCVIQRSDGRLNIRHKRFVILIIIAEDQAVLGAILRVPD